MGKLNLIFDFNNMAIRSMYTCMYMSPTVTKVHFEKMNTDEEIRYFINKLATDVCFVMKIFSPDRVIFVCDSHNEWRKDLYDDIPDMEYKGTRVKDEDIDWDTVFKALAEFQDILAEKGFVVTKINRAEADDLAALWKNNLFCQGENLVLVSSDRDWTQLAEFNGKNYCLCFNPITNNKGKKVLYLTASSMQWLYTDSEGGDIFNMKDSSEKTRILDSVNKDRKIEFDIMEPDKVLLEKIMAGDDGDNVPSIMEFYRNGRKTRVTALKAQKILEMLDSPDLPGLIKGSTDGKLKDALEAVMKSTVDFDVPSRLSRQRSLVELNVLLFPMSITESFKYFALDNADKGTVYPDNMKASAILKDTKYEVTEQAHKKPLNRIFDSAPTPFIPNVTMGGGAQVASQPEPAQRMPINYEPSELPPIAKKGESIPLF